MYDFDPDSSWFAPIQVQEIEAYASQPSRFGKLSSLFNTGPAKVYLKNSWKSGYAKSKSSCVVRFGRYKVSKYVM